MAKILVVERDSDSRLEITEILSGDGHEMRTAENIVEALQYLHTEVIDIVIADYSTNTCSDIKLLSKVRHAAENTIIIALSDSVTQELLSEALRNRVYDYIAKPYTHSAISRSVANALQVKVLKDKALLYKSDLKGAIDDLTKQLMHTQRLASVGAVTSEIIHEVKNQITLITVSCAGVEQTLIEIEGFMKEELAQGAASRERVKFVVKDLTDSIASVKSGIDRALKVLNGFGRFTRKESEMDVSCDLNACVKQSLDLCRVKLKGSIHPAVDFAQDLPAAQVESQLVQQVLVNLLLNSADAVEFKGGGNIAIKTFHESGHIGVEIKDDGPGIPEEKFPRIWEPFYTTKHSGKGNGLGLSISKRIVEGIGGTISASNAPGGGAKFTIKIPVKEGC